MTSEKVTRAIQIAIHSLNSDLAMKINQAVKEIFIDHYVKIVPMITVFPNTDEYKKGYLQAMRDLYEALVGSEFPEDLANQKLEEEVGKPRKP